MEIRGSRRCPAWLLAVVWGGLVGVAAASCSSGGSSSTGTIPGFGAACTSDTDCGRFRLLCGPDQKCVECAADTDCVSGLTCRSGVCRLDTSAGGSGVTSSGGAGGVVQAGCEPACPMGTVCDRPARSCVQCIVATDCPGGQVCLSNVCGVPNACSSSLDCSAGAVCNSATGVCVDCLGNNDCSANETCISSQCVPNGTGGTGGTGGTTGGTGGTTGGTGGTTGGTGGTISGTPCEGVCSDPTLFNFFGAYNSAQLGSGALCLETTTLLTGGNCYNFTDPRTFSVNGVVEPCGANWTSMPTPVRGGYCIQISAGDAAYATFALWGTEGAGGGKTPCEGVCDTPTSFSVSSGAYLSPKLGTGASCFETTSTIIGGLCNNFTSPRTVRVNGVSECGLSSWSIPAPVRGGYCLEVNAGDTDYADFNVW